MFKSQLEPPSENFVETQIFVENIFDTVKKAREAKAARSLAESKLAHYDYSFDYSPSKRKKTRKNAKGKNIKNISKNKTTPKKKPRKPRTPKDSAEKKKMKQSPSTPKTPRKYTKRATKVKPQNDIDDEEAAFILSSISQRSFDSFYNRLNGNSHIQIPLEPSSATIVQPEQPEVTTQPQSKQQQYQNHAAAYHHVLLDHNYWIVEPPPPPQPAATVVVQAEEQPSSVNLLHIPTSSQNSTKVEVNNNKLPLLDVNCDGHAKADNAVKKRWLRQATTECSPSPTVMVTTPETSPNDMKAPLKKRRVVMEIDEISNKIGTSGETERSKVDGVDNLRINNEAIKVNNNHNSNFVNNSAFLKVEPAESVNINLIHEKIEIEFGGRQQQKEHNIIESMARSVIQSPIMKNNLTYGIQLNSPVDVNAIYGRNQAENLVKIETQPMRSVHGNEQKLIQSPQTYEEKAIKLDPDRQHDFRSNSLNIVEVKFSERIPQSYGIKTEIYDNIHQTVKPEIYEQQPVKIESEQKIITVDGKLQQILDGKIQKIYRDSHYFVDGSAENVHNYGQFYSKVNEPVHQMSVIQGINVIEKTENSYRNQFENLQKQNHIIIHTGTGDKAGPKLAENYNERKVYNIYNQNHADGFSKVHQPSPTKTQLSPTKIGQLKGFSSPTKIQISPTRTYEIYTKNPHENVAESLLKLQQESPVKLLKLSPAKVMQSPPDFQASQSQNHDTVADHGYQKVQAEKKPKKTPKVLTKAKTKAVKVKKTPTKAKKVQQKPKKTKTPKSPSKAAKSKKNSVKIDKNLIQNFTTLEDVPLKIRQSLAINEEILMKIKESDGNMKRENFAENHEISKKIHENSEHIGKIPENLQNNFKLDDKLPQIIKPLESPAVSNFNHLIPHFEMTNPPSLINCNKIFNDIENQKTLKPSKRTFSESSSGSSRTSSCSSRNSRSGKSPASPAKASLKKLKFEEECTEDHGILRESLEASRSIKSQESLNKPIDGFYPRKLDFEIGNPTKAAHNHLIPPMESLSSLKFDQKVINDVNKSLDILNHEKMSKLTRSDNEISKVEHEMSRMHQSTAVQGRNILICNETMENITSSKFDNKEIYLDNDSDTDTAESVISDDEYPHGKTIDSIKTSKTTRFEKGIPVNETIKLLDPSNQEKFESKIVFEAIKLQTDGVIAGKLVQNLQHIVKSADSALTKSKDLEEKVIDVTLSSKKLTSDSSVTSQKAEIHLKKTDVCLQKSNVNLHKADLTFHKTDDALHNDLHKNDVNLNETATEPSKIVETFVKFRAESQSSSENLVDSKHQITIISNKIDEKRISMDSESMDSNKIQTKISDNIMKTTEEVAICPSKSIANNLKIISTSIKSEEKSTECDDNFLTSGPNSMKLEVEFSKFGKESKKSLLKSIKSNEESVKSATISTYHDKKFDQEFAKTDAERPKTLDQKPSKIFIESDVSHSTPSIMNSNIVEPTNLSSKEAKKAPKSARKISKSNKRTSESDKTSSESDKPEHEQKNASEDVKASTSKNILLSPVHEIQQQVENHKVHNTEITKPITDSQKPNPVNNISLSLEPSKSIIPQPSIDHLKVNSDSASTESTPVKISEVTKSILDPISSLKPLINLPESIKSIIEPSISIRSISESSTDFSVKPEKVVEQQVASILEKVIPKTLKVDFVKELEEEKPVPTETEELIDDEDDTQYRETVEEFHKDTLEKLMMANKRFCRDGTVHNPFKHSVSYDGRDSGRYQKSDDYHSSRNRGYDYDDPRKPLKMSLSFDSHQHQQQYNQHHSQYPPPNYQRSISEVFHDPRKERWCGNGIYENRNYGSFHYDKIHHRDPITTTYSMYRAQKASQIDSRWNNNRPTYEYPVQDPPPQQQQTQQPLKVVNNFVAEVKPIIQPQTIVPPVVVNSYRPPQPEPIRCEPPVVATVVNPQAEALKNATSDPFAGIFKDLNVPSSPAVLPKTKTASSDPRLNPSLVQDVKKDEPATPKKKLSLDQYRKRKSLTNVTQISPSEEILPSISVSITDSPSPTLPPAFDPSIAAAAATG